MNTIIIATSFEKRLSGRLLFAAFLLFLLVLSLLFQPAAALGDWSGGHDVSGSGEGRKTWYFAEGCTRLGFEEWVCLMNPNDVTANANCSYILGDGQVVVREEVLPPRSRITVNVRAVIPPDNDVSLAVASDQNIVVERPMYFRYHNDITGGHDVMGAAAPRDVWYFAEGCSRDGFDTWLCLQNPGDEAALYDISYYCGDGAVEERKDLTLGPHSRFTIPVHEAGLGLGRYNDAHGDFSIAVRTTNGVPLVVERPMYFRYHSILPEWQSVDRIALAQSLGTGEIFNGNTSRMCVALTFDIEGDPTGTAVILDVLRACDVHCTFFVLGTFADAFPSLIKRMADEGHEVASHSYSHADFTSSSPATRYSEIVNADTAISRVTGYSPKPYFRFPYGARNSAALSQLNSLGYLSVNWNVDPSDYTGISSATLYMRVMSEVRPGAIVVMHGGYASQKAGALPAIIRDLRASGYEPVTVTEALLAED
jgi:peptidoglycan/xylan/chitin deacetylase (PgdA/CDA1 family)